MYGCDCDGIERPEQLDHGRPQDVARGVLVAVERVTGIQPPTCPWRAFYEPVVRDVLGVSWATGDAHALGPVVGPDPDHKLMVALGVYTRAKVATTADEQRIRDEERERERQRKQATMNAQRGRHG